MENTKCALLDADFISKLYVTRKDEGHCLMDLILELDEYRFVCHEQILNELERHDGLASVWLKEKLDAGKIHKYSDSELLDILKQFYGENAVALYSFYLKSACDIFEDGFYERYYQMEERTEQFVAMGDEQIGMDHNLGEIKTYVMQKVLENIGDISLYFFCSDDKKARAGLSSCGRLPCISAIASFYVLKVKGNLPKIEAKLYFDSWMKFHEEKGQTSFKVHNNTKEMQLVKIDGYEIFERIYDGTITLLKNGNLKIKEVVENN